LKNDVKNKINGDDCYPIFATIGINARINFGNTSYLHHFTNNADREFYYFIKLFSRTPYFLEDISEENVYVLFIHLYNYDEQGMRVDIIKDIDFFDTLENVLDTTSPISQFFMPHHRFVLSFDGGEKYSLYDFEETVELWREETLNT